MSSFKLSQIQKRVFLVSFSAVDYHTDSLVRPRLYTSAKIRRIGGTVPLVLMGCNQDLDTGPPRRQAKELQDDIFTVTLSKYCSPYTRSASGSKLRYRCGLIIIAVISIQLRANLDGYNLPTLPQSFVLREYCAR